MDKKTLAIVSYITIIGWIIAYINYNNSTEKASLTRYHLKQALGIGIIGIVLGVVVNVIATIIPSLAMILSLSYLALLVLWIFGIMNAMNEKETPVPLVGQMFEDKFDFIK
jgi:uncharacterized membrane protein